MTEQKPDRGAPQLAWADGLWPFVLQVALPVFVLALMVGCLYRLFVG